MQVYVVLLAIVLVGCFAGGVALIAQARHRERMKLERYTRNPGGEPRSIVCPRCARRSYSQTAIRDRYCPACRTYHDGRTTAEHAAAAAE